MAQQPLRRNIKKSEQGKRPPAPPKIKPKNFVVSYARTNKSGGRRP